MISDMHVHTKWSSDSETPVENQIERAIELGMKQLCITDHQDYDAPPLAPDNFNFLVGNTGETEPYLKELRGLKEKYEGRIELLIGLELGLQGHLGERLKEYAQCGDFDFYIGSSHYFDGMDGGDRRLYEGRSGKAACLQYFTEELENVKAFPDFDVVGHIDFVLRHAPGGAEAFRYADYSDIIDDILRRAIDSGKGIECNTSPMRNGGPQPNPNRQILKRYAELGGEILTFGSDAHTPDRLGENFQAAAELAKDCGIRYYAVFRKHKPSFYPL